MVDELAKMRLDGGWVALAGCNCVKGEVGMVSQACIGIKLSK